MLLYILFNFKLMLPVSHFVYQLLPWNTNDTEKGVTLSIRVRSKVEMQVVTFVFLCDVIVGVTSASPSVSLRKRFTDEKGIYFISFDDYLTLLRGSFEKPIKFNKPDQSSWLSRGCQKWVCWQTAESQSSAP